MRVGFLFMLFLPGIAAATTIEYSNDEELFFKASTVVLGHVWSEQVLNVEGMVRSKYEVEIQEVIKGKEKPGHYIVVETLGGQFENGSGEYVAGSPHPGIGSDVILFLVGPWEGEYFIHSLALGHYEIRYHTPSHRFLAHRETSGVQLVGASATELAGRTVSVPEDRLATEILFKLRRLASRSRP